VLQRRVRHITSIQVRNLTPFPVRDEAATALVQPAEQSQFTPHGTLSDDLDVTLARKRGRRRSSTSVYNIFNSHEAPGAESSPSTHDSPVRQRALSRASIGTPSNAGLNSTPKARSTAGPPLSRPQKRTRTLSSASSLSNLSSGAAEPTTSSLSPSGLLRDTSQSGLEKILQSRLVETFITISIPPLEHASDENNSGSLQARTDAKSPELPMPSSTRRGTVGTSEGNSVPSLSAAPKRGPLSRMTSVTHTRALSSSAIPNGKPAVKPSAPQTLPRSGMSQHPRTPSAMSNGSSSRPTTPDSSAAHDDSPVVPDYLSPIHRPSTNPLFQLDAKRELDFAKQSDLSGCRITVEIWGKVIDPSSLSGHKSKGKERARYADGKDSADPGGEWKVLEHWEVNLNDLIPIPDDVSPLVYHNLQYTNGNVAGASPHTSPI
jgi:UV radiation resistance-associated gene protein